MLLKSDLYDKKSPTISFPLCLLFGFVPLCLYTFLLLNNACLFSCQFNNFSLFYNFSVVFFAVLISFITFAVETENNDNDSDNKY
ncbi:hypothetical protein HMPREF0666_01663 [Prevotella sp. C561]|nr:hypothetical protein HMPREF0666_01663 [Prevotella sp. C561]